MVLENSQGAMRTGDEDGDMGARACSYLIVANGIELGDSIFKNHGGAVDVQELLLPGAHLKLWREKSKQKKSISLSFKITKRHFKCDPVTSANILHKYIKLK